jgi:hypothetical protein
LVGISFLYRYWTEVPKALKAYLSVASIVLIIITSAGIYGYLSSAYAKVAADPLKMNAEVQILNSQAETIDEEIKRKTQRLDQIISLRGQQENRIDELIAKSTTGSNTTIRNAQNQLTELTRTANTLQQEINKASAQRDSLRAKSLTTDVAITTNSDIGTFVYISRAIGVPLDTVVKWFILVIVLVFDPLSICLVLAYNFLLKKEQKDTEQSKIENQQKEYQMYNDLTNNSIIVEDKKETKDVEEKVQEIPQEVIKQPSVVVRPWTSESDATNSLDENLLKKLTSDDPFPQYMTKEETEDVLERFWLKKTTTKHKDMNLF